MPQMESFCYQGRSKGIQEIKEPNVSSTEMYSGTSQLLLIRSQNLRATKKHLKSLNKRAANAVLLVFLCFVLVFFKWKILCLLSLFWNRAHDGFQNILCKSELACEPLILNTDSQNWPDLNKNGFQQQQPAPGFLFTAKLCYSWA